MEEWNVVVTVHEHGWKDAFGKLGAFGLLKKTPFLNVLLMRADDLRALMETLREWKLNDPASLSFLSRLIPVTRTFTFQTPEEFEKKSRDALSDWLPLLAGKKFHVRMRRRGFKGKLSSMDEERMLDEFLLESLAAQGASGICRPRISRMSAC